MPWLEASPVTARPKFAPEPPAEQGIARLRDKAQRLCPLGQAGLLHRYRGPLHLGGIAKTLCFRPKTMTEGLLHVIGMPPGN